MFTIMLLNVVLIPTFFHFLKGKHVLVVGSVTPWVEILVLSLGAAKVDTLEYAKIKVDHPQVIGGKLVNKAHCTCSVFEKLSLVYPILSYLGTIYR